MSRPQLIVLSGPTASGKTSAAIHLAKALDTVILSADSRQFYREMTIGTAKPNTEELAAVPHYFINSHSIQQDYSVGDYEREAVALLEDLFQRYSQILLVGGSGLYIKAVCEGLDEFPAVPTEVKEAVEAYYEAEGLEGLQARLKVLDPVYYEEVDRQNPQRLLRAVMVSEASGQPFSSFRKRETKKRGFDCCYLLMQWEREMLYGRINQRVDGMVEMGLEQEARALYPFRHRNALQTVGYQELFDYFDGLHDFETAITLIKRNSRRYAKRQLTWFRQQTHWTPFSPTATSAMLNHIQQSLQQP